mgnify:CR=1 FL=1
MEVQTPRESASVSEGIPRPDGYTGWWCPIHGVKSAAECFPKDAKKIAVFLCLNHSCDHLRLLDCYATLDAYVDACLAGRGPVDEAVHELDRACSLYPPLGNPHEGYAVILEELDELWDEVKKKQGERSVEKLRKEAVQVAAMALRFIADICTEEVAQN